ncbi:expressed unknown protein [Seminavis robusta]|uniref:VWFD domain-containing protein n=1 Tax=Seminavis robusta TaxID=568900 RepID=A0A9N8DEJ8_9STRA|nr:expressed unknown protein [Seminavis robusta]|eukprot:Sro112_g055530.1 n/a (428) ;mRNA; r:23662-25020
MNIYAVILLLVSLQVATAQVLPPEKICKGPPITFTKPNFADWSDPANQDAISPSVTLTRADHWPLLNVALGQTPRDVQNPSGVSFAVGSTTDTNLVFQSFTRAHQGWIGEMFTTNYGTDVTNVMVMYLQAEDLYVDLTFQSWSKGRDGGGFSYTRSTCCQLGGCGSAMSGDPHVMSWSGEWFDYHGQCDLKLMHVPNFQGKDDLDVHVRTTGRYLYSYIETVAVRIGSETMEVSSWGEYSINGVENAMIKSQGSTALRKSIAISQIGGYPIFHMQTNPKTHRFDIMITGSSNITMSILKDIVSVRVHNPTKADFGNVVGLSGDFTGRLLARDGVTDLSGDINALGQEWQVRDDEPMLFQAVRAPQYPAKCILPGMTKKEARRLGEGIAEEDAKVACDHLRDDAHAFANCIYDVTATNDLDQAMSGAF